MENRWRVERVLLDVSKAFFDRLSDCTGLVCLNSARTSLVWVPAVFSPTAHTSLTAGAGCGGELTREVAIDLAVIDCLALEVYGYRAHRSTVFLIEIGGCC
jgi:hypothetical protein